MPAQRTTSISVHYGSPLMRVSRQPPQSQSPSQLSMATVPPPPSPLQPYTPLLFPESPKPLVLTHLPTCYEDASMTSAQAPSPLQTLHALPVLLPPIHPIGRAGDLWGALPDLPATTKRLRGTSYFLTYSQVGDQNPAVLEHSFNTTFALKLATWHLAVEQHATRGSHWHVIARFHTAPSSRAGFYQFDVVLPTARLGAVSR